MPVRISSFLSSPSAAIFRGFFDFGLLFCNALMRCNTSVPFYNYCFIVHQMQNRCNRFTKVSHLTLPNAPRQNANNAAFIARTTASPRFANSIRLVASKQAQRLPSIHRGPLTAIPSLNPQPGLHALAAIFHIIWIRQQLFKLFHRHGTVEIIALL